MFDLSIVIPAYNEETRLSGALNDIYSYLRKHPTLKTEVIVVNDGSTDRTHQVVQSFKKKIKNLKVVDQDHRGKGAAVKNGMLKAKGKLAIFTDADGATPFAEIDKLLAKIKQDYEIAIGSRALSKEVLRHQIWYRELAGKFFGLLSQILVLRGIKDTQCGFKLFDQRTIAPIFKKLSSGSAIFDLEVLARATQKGLKIAEVPVRWSHDQETRIPYNLQRSIRIFGELLRIRRHLKVIFPLKVKTD